ncbi:hypothetical protein [Burkholderia cepacia]|uniref:Lipoprotein n=1 Tax=Burkholderia cepacia TaxID=292 RepID=A0ABM6NVJ4_BURCE|nr:hypothetical protein [Burkholderia cepacia]AIO22965.1 hypothetical protein DM41_2930 [Burkholderia cepacia ATCC 25416]ALK18477.1 hypothetical protein APZ15_12040 [Burkholderia cepacia ATCC 25416]ASE96050.1 hypothetical protein CEQ23_22255 [Burkholderia cepacia]ATF78947.1 hypothetical protein CO711_17000 [Burkholderia cepacia]MCA8466917.1 hypothetical protein [Burkholderia cepacia]
MKKLMLLAAGIAASAFLVSGCQSLGPVQQSPAQIAAVLCPATNSAITQITAFNAAMAPTLPSAANANVVLEKTVTPIVAGACAAGATITSSSVQALITQGIPAIAGVVAALPLAPTTQAAIQAGFAAAELAVNLVGMYENALQAAKTSAAIPAAVPIQAPVTTSKAMTKFQPGDVLTAEDLNRNFQSLNRRLETLEAHSQPVELTDGFFMVPAVNYPSTPLAGTPLQ